jgi:hypothetical protein
VARPEYTAKADNFSIKKLKKQETVDAKNAWKAILQLREPSTSTKFNSFLRTVCNRFHINHLKQQISTGSGPGGRRFQSSFPHQSLPAGHYLTINVTGIVTGCTLELELVAVTVIVKVPGGVPCGGGGGGGEPPPQPMQSSTTNAPLAKTQRGICLLALSR